MILYKKKWFGDLSEGYKNQSDKEIIDLNLLLNNIILKKKWNDLQVEWFLLTHKEHFDTDLI